MFLARAVVLLTGSFSESKEDLKKTITTHGGQIVNTLSRKVTHVVRGEGASKTTLQEAEQLNIPIVEEDLIHSTVKEGKILVPWFTSHSTKISTNETITKLFHDSPLKNRSDEEDSHSSEEEKEEQTDEEVNQMEEKFQQLTHEEAPTVTPKMFSSSSKQEVSPSKEEEVLSPLSKVIRAKELVVEARKLESEGRLDASLEVYRKGKIVI